jgi:outer membrane protein assembly factor BamB
MDSSPAVAGRSVYVTSGDGKLSAFSVRRHHQLFRDPQDLHAALDRVYRGHRRQSSPAVANGVVYAGGYGADLYAFSASGTTNCSGTPKTCTPLWSGPTGQYFYSSPALADGVVYATSDQKLYAFSH